MSNNSKINNNDCFLNDKIKICDGKVPTKTPTATPKATTTPTTSPTLNNSVVTPTPTNTPTPTITPTATLRATPTNTTTPTVTPTHNTDTQCDDSWPNFPSLASMPGSITGLTSGAVWDSVSVEKYPFRFYKAINVNSNGINFIIGETILVRVAVVSYLTLGVPGNYIINNIVYNEDNLGLFMDTLYVSCLDNSLTPTPTPTPTNTVTPSLTPTNTVIISPTPTSTDIVTPTPTKTVTSSLTPTKTVTRSLTPTKTRTPTPSTTKPSINNILKVVFSSWN